MIKDKSVKNVSDKVLTGFGRPLKNVLWLFDSETNSTRNLHVARRAGCPVCSSATQPS
jgi:molybdopterin-synthase adenylyltransferase